MDVTIAAELDSDELPDDYKTCIYRVVQEALHNCARHSHATTIRIRVGQEPDRLLLTIQDDGQGFDVQETKGNGAARDTGACYPSRRKIQNSLAAGTRNDTVCGIALHQGTALAWRERKRRPP